MLTIALLKKASDATNYYAKDNYYTQSNGVEQSWWHGIGAEKLGLQGNVNAEIFERLLKGVIDDETQLGRITKKGTQHRPGWDFTFSAPKSLSILSEIYGVDLLRQAHEQAVQAALTAGEQRFARARVSKDGKMVFENTKNLVVAAFTHDVSRELEPQIHTHTIHINATHTATGWKSLSPELFFKNQHQFSRSYKNELAKRVTRLGFTIRPSRFDSTLFEIDGISDDMIEFYSTRSQQIRSMLESHGIEYNSKDAKIASLITRRKKQTVARVELRKIWRSRADRFLQQNQGLSVSVAKLVNALQSEGELAIDVPKDVFSLPEKESIESSSEPKETITKSVHETEHQALDALAEQFLKISNTTVVAKDGIQKIVLDDAIRRRLIESDKLKGIPVFFENKKRIFLSHAELAQTKSYRIGDVLVLESKSWKIIAIKNNQGLILENPLGERQFLSIQSVGNKSILLRQQFLEIRSGEKIRFTSNHPELGIRKGDTAFIYAASNDSLEVKVRNIRFTIINKNIDFEYAYSRVERATRKLNKSSLAYIDPGDSILDRIQTIREKGRPHTVFLSQDTNERLASLDDIRVNIEAVRPVRQAIRHLQEREMASTVPAIIETAKRFQKRELPDQALQNEVNRLIDKNYLLPAPEHPDTPNEQYWTTHKAIQIEDMLSSHILKGKEFNKSIASRYAIDAHLSKTKLNEVQKSAVIKALTSKHQYFAIQGDPGVGKTTTLKELRTFVGRSGYDVFGFAPSHQAVKELSESIKIQGFTVDRILVDQNQQSKIPKRKSLWLVDESGMLTTKKINSLLALAEEKQAKVILVGDHQQLESVGAGRGFYQMLDEGMDQAIIDKRMRQKNVLTRTVVDHVMKKEYGNAINELRNNNKLTTKESEIKAIESLVKDWTKLSKEDRSNTLVVAPTNEQRNIIDLHIREQLKKEGRLKVADYRFTSLEDRYLTEQQKRISDQYKVGDIIRINKPYSNVEGQYKNELRRDDYIEVVGIKKEHNQLVIKNVKNNRMSYINPLKIGTDKEGAITVYKKVTIDISIGDQVRWTDSRGHLGIAKNAEGVITDLGSDFVRIKSGDKSIKIKLNELRDAHISHNYSKTAYNVQGATSKRVMALMEGWRRNTTNQRSFMVALTRASDDMHLYTSSKALERDLSNRRGDNTRAKAQQLKQSPPII